MIGVRPGPGFEEEIAMRSVSVLFASLLLLPALAQAASVVHVVGLFPGAAVVNVQGQRQMVRVGPTGTGGGQGVSAAALGAGVSAAGGASAYQQKRDKKGG